MRYIFRSSVGLSFSMVTTSPEQLYIVGHIAVAEEMPVAQRWKSPLSVTMTLQSL